MKQIDVPSGTGIFLKKNLDEPNCFPELLAKILSKDGEERKIKHIIGSNLKVPFLGYNYKSYEKDKVPVIYVKNLEEANVKVDEKYFSDLNGMKVF